MAQNMDKPSHVFVPSPASTPSPYPNTLPDPSIFKQGFDQLLKNRGIRFVHHRAVPCPNMKQLDDDSHDPVCPHCDGSAILYYSSREIVGFFGSNSIERQFEYQGAWEIGSAVVTLPSEYDDGVQADFAIYDRLEVLDYTVRLWEQKEYEPRPDGKQQLRYPVQKVEYLVVADNSTKTEYQEGVDFTVEDGKIKWTPGEEPDYDLVNEVGDVFSVSYFANPIYVVLQPLRELRVTQQMMPDGTKVSIRLPQQLVVKRDFLVNPPEKIISNSTLQGG